MVGFNSSTLSSVLNISMRKSFIELNSDFKCNKRKKKVIQTIGFMMLYDPWFSYLLLVLREMIKVWIIKAKHS